jgi:glycerol kinase
MEQTILALDQGTTSSRAIVFSLSGNKIASSQKEFTQFTPRESWVEHDALEIWDTQIQAAREAVAGMPDGGASIGAIGITNQRETTVLWDRATGRPVHRAIVWQCRRSTGICRRLKDEGHEDFIRVRTGLMLDPYFSGTKIRWILDNDADLAARARRGEILFGTVDSWLLWNLTGGKVHATDVSNASRTLLMNIGTGQWDNEILDLLDIPREMLPEIRMSSGVFGESVPELFGRPIPVAAMAGDQHAALFGHRAFEPGMAKNTFGTGCFMLMNVGPKPVVSNKGLLSTVAWGIGGKLTYALEGSVFMAGALLQWLRDELGLVSNVQEIDRMAEKLEDSGGLYLVPAFQGLGTPWWRPDARGALLGLTRASTKAHICRAFLESIAYRTRDVLDLMISESGRSITALRVDGGVSNSDILMKFQADLLGITVERPKSVESTALGAALMAGVGAGIRNGLEDIGKLTGEVTVFRPSMSPDRRNQLYSGWLEAVGKII